MLMQYNPTQDDVFNAKTMEKLVVIRIVNSLKYLVLIVVVIMRTPLKHTIIHE